MKKAEGCTRMFQKITEKEKLKKKSTKCICNKIANGFLAAYDEVSRPYWRSPTLALTPTQILSVA